MDLQERSPKIQLKRIYTSLVRWPPLKPRENPLENQMDPFSPTLPQTNENINPQISQTGAPTEINSMEGSGSPNLSNNQHVIYETSIFGRRRIERKHTRLTLRMTKD